MLRRLGTLIAAVLVTACGTSVRRATSSSSPALITQSGTASWYGPGFDGKETSSGERYDQNALTAAHRTLPLGTRVRVTNAANGRSVDVRINDRGPFVDDRIIDLSRAAARALDMIGPGTAQVLIEVLESPFPIDSMPTSLRFTVQVGSFTNRANADELRTRIEKSARDVSIMTAVVGGRTYYRVQVGVFDAHDAAEREARRLRDAGIDAIVTERPAAQDR